MLPRAVVLLLLALVAACGDVDALGRPAGERTYLCGSYEPLDEGAVPTEPPC